METLECTKNWIDLVVIQHGLCPFAAKPFLEGAIRYRVVDTAELDSALHSYVEELRCLSETDTIETTLIVFDTAFTDFDDFLDFIAMAEQLIEDLSYHQQFLLAHFHPEYQFDGLEFDDVANYSNRSPKPILQLLRQRSIDDAVSKEVDLATIPKRNIEVLRHNGLAHHKQLLKSIVSA